MSREEEMSANLSHLLQITLVANHYYRNIFTISNSVNQFLVSDGFFETPSVRDGIADDKTFTFSHVLLTHGCEFRLQ